MLALTIGFFDCKCQYFYSHQREYNNWFHSIVREINTNNFLVLNSFNIVTLNDNHIKSQILKLDSQGNLIDSIFIDYNFVPSKRIIEYANNYYIFGTNVHYSSNGVSSKIVIYKFSTNFNLIKKKVLDSTYSNYNASTWSENKAVKAIVNNGILYLVSNSLFNNGYDTTKLFKLDSNLNKIKSVKHRGRIFDLTEHSNNLIVSTTAFPPPSFSPGIMEIDTGFNFISRFNTDSLTFLNFTSSNNQCAMNVKMNSLFSLNSISNNKYILTGEGSILKSAICSNQITESITSIIKNNSTIVKTVITGNSPVSNPFTSSDLQELSSYKSGYVFTARQIKLRNGISLLPDSIPRKIMIHKIDTSGNVKWVKYIGGDKFYYPTFTFADSDGGILVGGMYYDTLAPKVKYSAVGFIIKMDSLGNLVPFYTNLNKLTEQRANLSVYPNPSQHYVSFDIPFEENITIEFFDYLGQRVSVYKNYDNLSKIDVSQFSDGIYSYVISTKQHMHAGKLIVKKE